MQSFFFPSDLHLVILDLLKSSLKGRESLVHRMRVLHVEEVRDPFAFVTLEHEREHVSHVWLAPDFYENARNHDRLDRVVSFCSGVKAEDLP